MWVILNHLEVVATILATLVVWRRCRVSDLEQKIHEDIEIEVEDILGEYHTQRSTASYVPPIFVSWSNRVNTCVAVV